MAKKLTSTELLWSQPVLHDLFQAGGLLKHSIRTNGGNCIERVRENPAANAICEEIKYRNFDFPKLNDAIKRLSTYVVFRPLHESDGGNRKRLTEIQLANIIAAFCAEQEIFWDDVNTHRTTVEMETYRVTLLGRACWEFKCFLSQQADKKPARTAARAASTSTGKAAPKSGYKSSGPKSGLIGGLIGEPGEKTTFPVSDNMYVIVCDSTKTKKQYVFVDPLAHKADINKVRFGDPSGYSACKLFFDSIAEADAAMRRIATTTELRVPSDITGLSLAKQKVDPNGYFQINTEIGAAYIKASKLNEAIEEAVEDPSAARCSKFPDIGNIDVYNEAMYSYE